MFFAPRNYFSRFPFGRCRRSSVLQPIQHYDITGYNVGNFKLFDDHASSSFPQIFTSGKFLGSWVEFFIFLTSGAVVRRPFAALTDPYFCSSACCIPVFALCWLLHVSLVVVIGQYRIGNALGGAYRVNNS